MKTVKAVKPYIYQGGINFKHKPFDAWREITKDSSQYTANSHYPYRIFHRVIHEYSFPSLCKNKKEARLRFVQPHSLNFDTFPDYLFYEIIPFFWDVWPDTFDLVLSWLIKHKVKTAIFTSSYAAKIIKDKLPEIEVFSVTEGIDSKNYPEGKVLSSRNIDFFEYGREVDNFIKIDLPPNIYQVHSKVNGKIVMSNETLKDTLINSKIVIALPQCLTHPKIAGNIETLTQRYWECMLSRVVLVGHAPTELVNLLGYNPVIEIERDDFNSQIINILKNINDYQDFVDKNREMSLIYGDWKYSIKRVIRFLKSQGYNVDI